MTSQRCRMLLFRFIRFSFSIVAAVLIWIDSIGIRGRLISLYDDHSRKISADRDLTLLDHDDVIAKKDRKNADSSVFYKTKGFQIMTLFLITAYFLNHVLLVNLS